VRRGAARPETQGIGRCGAEAAERLRILRVASSDSIRRVATAFTKCLRKTGSFLQSGLMENLAMAVRAARPDDANAVARVYIDSWHDTYPAILPTELLRAMTPRGQEARWRATIVARGREQVLVAECAEHGVVGMTSFGPAQDKGLGYDGEVYTLYVAPDFFGRGIGSMLLRGAFAMLHKSHFASCQIWAHAQNPARYFYEAMGGRLIAGRSRRMMRTAVPEAAFGWSRLVLPERHAASSGKISRP
jgi:ribosomal protein S18 acetylase RimI-like enzyme